MTADLAEKLSWKVHRPSARLPFINAPVESAKCASCYDGAKLQEAPMYDWIIEADIYRLHKALTQAATVGEQHRLASQINAKKSQLLRNRSEQPALLGSADGGPTERIRRTPNYQY